MSRSTSDGWLADIDTSSIEVIVIRSPFRLGEREIAAFPALRCVVRAGSGRDGVDLEALASRGLAFKTCEGNANAVAELVFAFLLAHYRSLISLNAGLRTGAWRKFESVGGELGGKTLVVVGFGRVGRRVAAIANGFRMTVIAVERARGYDDKQAAAVQLGATLTTDLAGTLDQAHALVLACPLTPETHWLVDETALRRMQSTAVVINVARGAVWDFAAVAEAVKEGRLAGACCDVFEQEPPIDLAALQDVRIIATPHVGAQTWEAQARVGVEVLAALRKALRERGEK